MNEKETTQRLLRENEELRIRLQEAEDTINAIREGAVDAVVIQGPAGDRVFTLSGEEIIYRRLVETMNEAGLTTAPDGTILFCNERFSGLLEMPMENILGQPLEKFLHDASLPVFSSLIKDVHAGPVKKRLVFKTRRGTLVPALTSANLLRQADSVSICLVATDMTDLESSEEMIRQLNENREALRHSEERSRRQCDEIQSIYDSVHVGLCVFDCDLRYLRVNQRLAEMNGISAADHIGRTVEDVVPAMAPIGRRLARQIFETGQGITNVEFTGETLALPGVQRTWVEQWLPLRDAAGTIIGFNIAAEEITERKRIQETLQKANDELEMRVRQRTKLLDAKNDELKLRADQLSRLASELTLAEKRERHRLARILHDHIQQLLVAATLGLETIRHQLGEHFTGTLRQVNNLLVECLGVSRSLTVELSPTILHEAGLVAGVEWLARWMHKKHGLQIEIDAQTDIAVEREDIRILLFECVRELLFNVVKHAGVAKAQVTLKSRDDDFEITVSDEGVGLDTGTLDANRNTSSGFGLFSIRERLELLGGRLMVESAPNRGARFILIAPAQPRLSRIEQKSEWKKPSALQNEARPDTHTKMRVLVADDHAVVRQGLCNLLLCESEIQVVGQAADGEQAMQMARQLRPDIILMDYSMPVMNGVEATKAIHSDLPEIRIIGLSMYEEADRAKAMLEAGAATYINKSDGFEKLITAIHFAHRQAHKSSRTIVDIKPLMDSAATLKQHTSLS